MNQREKEIIQVEENFKDTLENELYKNIRQNKKINIRDIRYIGKVEWKDRITGKKHYENLLEIEKQITEIDKEGSERIRNEKHYYLGNKCIGGTWENNKIAYKESFKQLEQEKLKAVEKKLNKNDKKDIDKIKVNAIQKADLNRLVDGKETLGKRLDLQGYDNLYVVYSTHVNEINPNAKRNTSTYSLIGINKKGEAKVLNDEFELDSSVGNSGGRTQTKIRSNQTATRDSNDSTVFKRKSNGVSIGCENYQGRVNMFFYPQKTREENENTGIQIETQNIYPINRETQRLMSRGKGTMQIDNIQDEIQEHTDRGHNAKGIDSYDGDKDTFDSTDFHIDYKEINENDYIPNTKMTWRNFANACGYRGEGSLEKAVDKINSLEELNENSVKEYIEEQEELDHDYRR